MNSCYSGGSNRLELLRQTQGSSVCLNQFLKLLKSRRQEALRLLNDPGLPFATLFLLEPEIISRGLEKDLGERNRNTIRLCAVILSRDKKSTLANVKDIPDEKKHSILLWIFRTGWADDGFSSEFDRILDISAAVLLKKYREDTILPSVARLIFQRNRKGTYLHDLTWAFFQTHNANYALQLLSGYLLSQNEKDRELACLLLHVKAGGGTFQERQKQYRNYRAWLRENSPYLYFTGESLLFSNAPNACGIDLDAKYLCKYISPRNRRPSEPLTESEQNCLECFHRTDDRGKKVLAGYSHKIHSRNPNFWSQWIRLPVDRQLNLAQSEGRRLV